MAAALLSSFRRPVVAVAAWPCCCCCFLLLLLLMVVSMKPSWCCEARMHVVGGVIGWAVPDQLYSDVNYTLWAQHTNFYVGDTLLFEYEPMMDNVLEVTSEDFKCCSSENALRSFNGGSTMITLDKVGNWYFLSGFPNHCMAGQKVAIHTSMSTTTPSPLMNANSTHGMSPSNSTIPTSPSTPYSYPYVNTSSPPSQNPNSYPVFNISSPPFQTPNSYPVFNISSPPYSYPISNVSSPPSHMFAPSPSPNPSSRLPTSSGNSTLALLIPITLLFKLMLLYMSITLIKL